jgi:tRNA(Arg) A34 adenosine deaminase TadA
MVLYTTGEPCSMCMSALVWAGIGGVVFASSIDGIRRAGIDQIAITA